MLSAVRTDAYYLVDIVRELYELFACALNLILSINLTFNIPTLSNNCIFFQHSLYFKCYTTVKTIIYFMLIMLDFFVIISVS